MSLAHTSPRILENFTVIWCDLNIDQSSNHHQHSISQLRQIIPSIKIFTFIDDCVDYLNEMKNEKVFLIVSGSLGQEIVPIIQNIPCLYAIYIFCSHPTMIEPSITEFPKVKGAFVELELLCVRLQRDLYQTDHNLTSISILSPVLPMDLNQLDQAFMYSQLLKGILLKITYDDNAKKEFVRFCRDQCSENDSRLSVIDEFEQKYDPSKAIQWYTRNCFIYSMLNRALRTQEIDIILKMGFFIRDLHRQIKQLYLNAPHFHSLTLYRGQGMNSTEFEKLYRSKCGLLSFNSFLSTSVDEQVGFMFADSAKEDPDLTGVLFQIDIDSQYASIPFASLSEASYFEGNEGEILFSMHTIFRIVEMNELENRLWKVKLLLTTDHDKDLKQLTDFIHKEISGGTEWDQLVTLMLKMGEYNKAEEIHRVISGVDSIDDIDVQNRMGMITTKKGNKKLALSFYKRALEIQEKSSPINYLMIAILHNNISEARLSIGEYSIALDHFNKALSIQQPLLPEKHPDLGRTYSHIGAFYWFTGEYAKSLEYSNKALVISQECLPQYHPDLGTAHNSIAEVYESLGNYPSALVHFEKTFKIRQRTLPPNHPDLAGAYNNIGEMYHVMGKSSIALMHFQTALGIQQKSLPANHPDLAIEHNNIGEVYRLMENYAKALPHYKQALEIQQELLPSDHPGLATIHNNIGLTYASLQNYSAASKHYEEALKIKEKSLPPNHPDIALLHNNIGLLCQSIGDNTKALAELEKTLEIQQQGLSVDHPDLGKTYSNIGTVYLYLGDYSTAVSHMEKALEIWHKSFPPDHPYLKNLHLSLSAVYSCLQRHDDAMRHSLMGLGIIAPGFTSAREQSHILEDELD